MKLKKGELVVYENSEICRYDGAVEKSFGNGQARNYLMFVPVFSRSTVYYLPRDRADDKIRKLLSKQEVLKLIDEMPLIEPVWVSDRNERKNAFSEVLRNGDRREIISVIKAVYLQRQKLANSGKKLQISDEKTLSEAERLVKQEFSIVLDIEPAEVTDFIKNRIDRNDMTK